MVAARFHLLTPVAVTGPTSWRPQVHQADGAVAWRLLGANNRELGRSTAVFDDVARAEAAINALRQDLAALVVVLQRHDSSGLWTWRIDARHGPVACSSRGYSRQRECQYALQTFREVVPGALITGQPLQPA